MNIIMYAVIVTAGLLGAIFIYAYHSDIQIWSAHVFKIKKWKAIERYKFRKSAMRIPVTGSGFPEIKRKDIK